MSKARTLSVIPNSTLGFRNRIINGAMMIDQRNAGGSVTNLGGALTWSVDRWRTNASSASKFTMQQNAGSVTPPVGFTKYLGITSTSAFSVGTSEYFYLSQSIEGLNCTDLAWGTSNAKTLTLSFWVRSSLTGTFSVLIMNAGGDAFYPNAYTINSSNTWEYKTIQIPGPTFGTWATDNSTCIDVRFALGIGSAYSNGTSGVWSATNYYSPTVNVMGTSGATFYITGVQLEVGSSATSFEYRQYGQELALCQRYYTQWGKSATFAAVPMGCLTASVASCRLFFPVTMRASPCSLIGTINTDYQAYYNGGYKTLSNAGISDVTADSLRLDAVTSSLFGGGGCALFYVQTTTGAITASAEL